MNRSLPFLYATCLTLTSPAAAQTVAAPQTVVFGDSSVEQGNLYSLPGHARPDTPYYSEGGFSRESNGPVWVEYIVPGIVPERGASAQSRNVNFAYSGATSGYGNIASDSRTGFSGQVDAWLARAAATGRKPASADLFVVAAGVNDFIRDLGERDLRDTSKEVIDNLSGNLGRMAAAGARTILVEDLPQFIHAPLFNDIVPPADRAKLEQTLKGLGDAHNAAQIAALAKLRTTLPPGTNLVTVKVSKLFDHIRAHAAELGFSNISSACYDAESGRLCSPNVAGQNAYLFFDDLHLTTKAQALQADYYGALLGQLGGSANLVQASIGLDIAAVLTGEAVAERGERHRLWAADASASGFAVVGDIRLDQQRRNGGVDVLGSRGDRRAYRLGLAYSDGDGWTTRIVGSRIESDLTHSQGRHDVGGWAVTASGERRFGALRLGASATHFWGDAEGTRFIPVARMTSSYGTKVAGTQAEFEAGVDLGSAELSLIPSAWARYDRATVDGYAETGNTGLEMAFGRTRQEALYAGAGVTIAYNGSKVFQPRLTAAWESRVAGSHGTVTGMLVDNSANPISARIGKGRRSAASVEPGLSIGFGNAVVLDLSGHQHLDAKDRGVRARLALAF